MTAREQRILLRAVNRAAERGDGLAYPGVIRLVLHGDPSPLRLRLALNALVRDGLLRLKTGSMQRAAYEVTSAGRALLVGRERVAA